MLKYHENRGLVDIWAMYNSTATKEHKQRFKSVLPFSVYKLISCDPDAAALWAGLALLVSLKKVQL